MENKIPFDLLKAFEDFEKSKKEIFILEGLQERREKFFVEFEEFCVPSFLR